MRNNFSLKRIGDFSFKVVGCGELWIGRDIVNINAEEEEETLTLELIAYSKVLKTVPTLIVPKRAPNVIYKVSQTNSSVFGVNAYYAFSNAYGFYYSHENKSNQSFFTSITNKQFLDMRGYDFYRSIDYNEFYVKLFSYASNTCGCYYVTTFQDIVERGILNEVHGIDMFRRSKRGFMKDKYNKMVEPIRSDFDKVDRLYNYIECRIFNEEFRR